MLIRDVMTRDVTCVSPKLTLVEAAQKMQSEDVGALPICDNDRLIGMVTDRDIVVKAIADGIDPAKAVLSRFVKSPIVWCFEDQTVDEAADLMAAKKIRRIVVLTRDKRICGILSLGDIAARSDNRKLPGETLAAVAGTPSKAAA